MGRERQNSHVPRLFPRSPTFQGENWYVGWPWAGRRPLGELCCVSAELSGGLQPRGGGILVGAHRARPLHPLQAPRDGGYKPLHVPSDPGERRSLGKGERGERERICTFLFICEFTEMLAFVQRKTFHVSATWWMKLGRSEKERQPLSRFVCR